ncbi:hypothetical protein ASPWEDRAFT_65708 [Aspergillus wentii DTO 134E9]|uniref:Cytochrome P450 n=1 Tax=Aspergillus wentii DTO 134E9 TaxID=1073089 RepID=A0A1L9RUY7_ASPWE|nr:uncharacterized protein ASPWEDRAFT_65708 [Aspergillus wentii DTO 134E9]KAI9928657.1 Cytochrome P450 52A3 [Aspergillus wentii]OJJ38742.1 hypothetical protein ASPWEDRAFT_65708 [Aspergillus wentii DTO 134E9]
MIVLPISILSTLLFSIFFIARQAFLRHKRSKHAKQLNAEKCARSPGGLLGIRNFLGLKNAHSGGRMPHHFQRLHQQYGATFNIAALGKELIFTIEPENIQALLTTQFSEFGLAPSRHDQWFPLFGEGIFTDDGRLWEHSRKMLRPRFTKDQVPDVDWFDVHSNHFIDALPKDGRPFDIQELVFRLTLDGATDLLYGESVDSLVSPLSNQTGVPEMTINGKKGFAEAFEHSQFVVFQRTFSLGFHWLINPPGLKKSSAIVHKFLDYFVNKALDSHKPDAKEEQGRYSYLKALASYSKDRKAIRDQMVHVMLASRDDTGSLLASCFYFLARDKRAWGKLKAEVTQAVQDHDSTKITIKEIQNLPYLRAVVNEALRLFPPVPINARVALKDTTIPVGGGPDGQAPVYVHQGQTVSYSVWALHRRQDIWGPDADEFRPERWDELKPAAWQFLPFNGGPRACVGQLFALAQASHLLFRVLERFDVLENARPGPDMGSHPRMHQTLTMCHEKAVEVRLC